MQDGDDGITVVTAYRGDYFAIIFNLQRRRPADDAGKKMRRLEYHFSRRRFVSRRRKDGETGSIIIVDTIESWPTDRNERSRVVLPTTSSRIDELTWTICNRMC